MADQETTAEDSFLQTWEDNKRQLWSRIRKLVHHRDEADDLLQEVFVRVYQHAAHLDTSYLPKYFMRASTNITLDYLARQKRIKYRAVDQVCEETPYDQYARTARQDELRNAIDRLRRPQRQAINAYLEGNTTRQRAKQLGIPYSTLRYRERRALQHLKRDLRE